MNEADTRANTERDSIDEGQRLIRVDGEHGLSLAERMAERFYRLTWRTPLHALRLRGRYPSKLLAVPDDPIPGNVERGRALLDGVVSFRGEQRALLTIDYTCPDFTAPFADYLHGFAWLRDLSSAATASQGALVAELMMALWLDAHADRVGGIAWAPGQWGRRIMAWCAHAPLILSSSDLIYRSKVLHTLARGARHLNGSADKAPPGPARIAAWCGIAAAGLLIPGGEPRRVSAEAGLRRALSVSVFADGGSVSRSPAMLLDSIALLTSLRACYSAGAIDMPAFVAPLMARMVGAFLGTLHGDGTASSWQGGGPIGKVAITDVITASGVRARPLRQAGDWGYQRLTAGSAIVIVDAAPPPAGRLAAGGCASTLAFEFSDGDQRIIANCGGAGTAASLPPAIRQALRTTAAHSTLVLADSNSTALHPDGTLGRGVAQVELSRQESDVASRIEASHDGYVRRHGFVHRRQLTLAIDGRELRGEDSLLPQGHRRQLGTTPFAIRFHLGRGIEVSPTADASGAMLRLSGGPLWQLRCRGGLVGVEESVWIDATGRALPTRQVVVTGETTAGGVVVSWALKRAR